MPLIKSAIKRMRQTARRRSRNITTKRNLKGAVKAFIANPSVANLQAAQSELDTAVKKNVLKKNTASRRKAQLAKVAKDAGTKPETAKKPAAKSAPKASTKPTAKSASKPAAKKTATPKATKAPAKKPAAKKAAPKKAA